MRQRLFLLVAAAPAALTAQGPRQLTADDYARAERLLPQNVTPLVHNQIGRPTWLAGGALWYRASRAQGAEYMLVDPAARTKRPAFAHGAMAAALALASGGAVDSTRLVAQELAPDRSFAILTARGKRWRCTLGTSIACSEAPAGPQAPPASMATPDGRGAVFIRNANLVLKTLATSAEQQLTTDGVPDFGYATDNAGWTHGDNPVGLWSPDGTKYATFRHDGRAVKDMYLVRTMAGAPQLERWKYPLPGDSIFMVSRTIVHVPANGAAPKVVPLTMPPDAHRSTVSDHIRCDGGVLCDAQWYPDGSKLAFISSSRDHKRAVLRVADATSGDVRDVLAETSTTQIGDASMAENLWKVLPASNEVIWWSQRDNWIHLYLYDLTTGKLKHRITTGEGNVTQLVRVDEKARQIWFTAVGKEAGRDPYYQHLYRVGFDGKGLTLLTPEPMHHTVSVSDDGRWIVDTYSTPDVPSVTVLRYRNGKVLDTLERTDISRLVATGWKAPTPIRVKSRDGSTDLYGLMVAPSSLDTTRKYPVVVRVYPGPQSGSMGPRSFVPVRGDDQALAELGFVVVLLDGMGTPGRSKAFHDFYYGRMVDNTIPDQIAAVKQLAERYRFVDADRAGIWGHSGGGFATGAAMLRHAGFFKVGIAESGNHDQRIYEDDWGDRYQGLLVRSGTTDNYAVDANQTYARNLQGKLFLIHGNMDDNVPPYNTLLVADALMKAGKDFDMLMLPNARHGFGADGLYIMRRRWDYFVQHLQGNIPPKEYPLGRSR
jgi:dipeptidyl-peptidase 4